MPTGELNTTAEVLVTGLGVTSCLGAGSDAFWSGLLAGTSAPEAFPDAIDGLPAVYRLPADVAGGSTSQLAADVAEEAVRDAALSARALRRARVVIATGMGDARREERLRSDGAERGDWSPAFVAASAVSERVGAAGASSTTSNACAASGYAVALGADLIRSGEAEVVLVGGAETYSRVALGCFTRLRAIDPIRCRPFDRGRQGTVFGEGAAMLVLESAAHARRRGASAPYARLAASGWSCDAYHATAPEESGEQIARAMREAMAGAADVPGVVVPHGTGTELNDRVEAHTLRRVLGNDLARVPLYSLKALTGHTGGAAGALALAAAVLMLRHGTVPGNVALDEQDPDCDVHLPQGGALPLRRPCALVNAYAFGGNNVSLRCEGIDA